MAGNNEFVARNGMIIYGVNSGSTSDQVVVLNTTTNKLETRTNAGSSGTSGTSGTDGSSGTSGSNGTDGSSGTSGSNGTDGSSGTSGSNGTDGSSGTSGSNGTDGSSGTSGIDGSSGTSGTDGQCCVLYGTSVNSISLPPTDNPTSGYTVTLSSCNTGNATYALGGSFVNGDIVEVKATFSGTGNAGVNNSNASLFLGTTGVATGSTCFTPTTFMSWNLSLIGTLTFSGGTTVFVRSLAENAAAASVNASTSLEITKINGVTVTGLSAVGCWDYSTGSPCTP